MSRNREFSEDDLEVLLIRAAERGARQAIDRISSGDDLADNDVRELRLILNAWRDVRRLFIRTAVRVLAVLIVSALAALVALKPS